jgi:uncharacterized protein YecE (DUF72 family)
MDLRVGTSGFGYPQWKGRFYPKGAASDRMLAYYSERFNAVELNHTFYRRPIPARLAAWAGQTPEGFLFTLKAPGLITHIKRLRGADQDVAAFAAAAQSLGDKLGALLFQLPPGLKFDGGLLRDFLAGLPDELPPSAFEFRSASWFRDETYAALAERGLALCRNDADVEGSPLVETARFGYLKLRKLAYSGKALRARAEEILRRKWDRAFVFFKHEERALGPRFASRFIAEWRAVSADTPSRAESRSRGLPGGR